MKKVWFYWGDIKSTFWFVPVLIIFVAIGMALSLVYFDSRITISREGIGRYLFIGSIDSARSILTTISGTMIGVAGTVFSITLVALTLASSQFGPRLIKNFMYVRLNQIVLGSYISTYIYCLLVLNTIKEYDQAVFVPSFSILFAQVVTLANIILLIVFIHHIAMSIQADNVVADISKSLSKNIKILFPEKVDDEMDEEKASDEDSEKSKFKQTQNLFADKDGYLQYIASDSLLEFAVERDILFELHFRPGDYLVAGVKLGIIHLNEKLNQDDLCKLQDQFITGRSRTHQEDAEHSIHQLVEIAVRALSPGVNDPYTAIACIDNLTSTMSFLSGVKFPSRYRKDEEGKLRIIADTFTYEGMLDASFNQIRQFSQASPAVAIRMMEALVTIHQFANKKVHKDAVKKHAVMLFDMAKKSFSEANDVKDLQERSKQILKSQT